MSIIQNNLLLAGDDAYNLQRSLRFRSSASAFLNRTPASAGNRQKFTLSMWFKRGTLSSYQSLFSAGSSTTNRTVVLLDAGASGTNNIFFSYQDGATGYGSFTTAVFRDPSAWYHLVISVDTTLSTASDRVKIYINGVQQTLNAYTASGGFIPQNTNLQVNNTVPHYIGTDPSNSYYDGYQTEINFIDGQALTPSSFGENNAQTGVWQPKRYTGTYGTNGFYLPFSDNSSLSNLTADRSGNGNNWTANNISLSSGATYDSMTDVPTLTSATASNFSVWNPLNNGLGGTVSFANMRLSGVSNVTSRINSTIGVSSGKWYFEATLTTADAFTSIGIGQNNITNQYPGNDALSYAQTLEQATSINNNTQPSYGTAFSSGDVFMCAFDLDTNKLFFGRNGTWFGSSNPATGTNPVYTLTAGTYNVIARPNPSGFSSNAVLDANFGQRPFAYTPPTGFVALNTFNLPTPTIGATASSQANKYFDATTYTGTGSTLNVNNSGSFAPDLVWIKGRSGATDHGLHDRLRGEPYARLASNNTDAETTGGSFISSYGGLTSTGFQLNTNTSGNNNGSTYVGWQWKANGTGVTNTAGSITSTVSANTSSGFSVVTYTSNNTGGATVGHGLGVRPSMIILKRRSSTSDWDTYHISLGATKGIGLNTTAAATTSINYWNNTEPTSTVFTLGAGVNPASTTMVAYCFSEVAGFSRFGSYTGNGSTDGPFVFCGFRPRYVMVKRTDSAYGWFIEDTARDTFNEQNKHLRAELSDAEVSGGWKLDTLSNGFKLRESGAAVNASGGTYIYMAFAEFPFRYSLAR